MSHLNFCHLKIVKTLLKSLSVNTQLSRLHLKTDKLTFAAYLLFVDNVSAITSLQIGRFKSETTIIDSISLNSDLIGQLDQSIDFIKKNLMLAYIITGKPEREERYDYPMEAIREIVVNMVVHPCPAFSRISAWI